MCLRALTTYEAIIPSAIPEPNKSPTCKYRISPYSFRGNYSFLNLTLCTVTFGNSTYRCGSYSREETIQGRKLYEEIRYFIHESVRTVTGKRNQEVAKTEVAGQNSQKMNIAKICQMRRGQAVWITKVKKECEISCKNIWPRLMNKG